MATERRSPWGLEVIDWATYREQFRQISPRNKFGPVYSAEWIPKGKKVALKIMKTDLTDKCITAFTLREMTILNKLKSHRCDALVRLLHMYAREDDTIIFVFELCETDLNEFLYRWESDGISTNHRRRLTWQDKWPLMMDITQGLCFLHSLKLIHCNIEPRNILITSKGRAKIAGFSYTRDTTLPDQTLTETVQCLWYRAPELMLGTKKYLFEIDMWSLGVLLSEVIRGSPLFEGWCEVGMLMRIMKMRGTPSIETWPDCQSLPYFNEMFPKFIGQGLRSVIKIEENHGDDCANEVRSQMVELINHLLMMNPRNRWNYQDVIKFGLFHHDSKSTGEDSSSSS